MTKLHKCGSLRIVSAPSADDPDALLLSARWRKVKTIRF
jgi:hypothetical protein